MTSEGAPRQLESAFYGAGCECVYPESYEEIADVVRSVESGGGLCVPSGGGSHAFLGNPPRSAPLVMSMQRLSRVLRYEPDDFTIGVQAGAGLRELGQLLAEHNQELALDVSGAEGATVGGLVAAALPGPRRARCGGVRSAVIGAHGMRGGGRRYKTGGMVVKNVAGYDIAKLVCGSLGTLGPIVEVNFRLRSIPERRRLEWAAFPSPQGAWDLVRELRAARLEPAALLVLDGAAVADLASAAGSGAGGLGELGPGAVVLLWLFEGNASLVEGQAAAVGRRVTEYGTSAGGVVTESAGAKVWEHVTQLWEPRGAPLALEALVRLAVLPSNAAAAHSGVRKAFEACERVGWGMVCDAMAGQLSVRWRGAEGALEAPLSALSSLAATLEGAAWLLYLPPEARRRQPYLLDAGRLSARASSEVVRRVAAVFDPAGVFCPGRIYGVA